jgi:transmembrane sensor
MTSDCNERERPVSEVAAEWFVRLKDGDLTPPERREYLQWLKRSPEHISEMLRVNRTHNAVREAYRGERSAARAPDENLSSIIDFATRGIVPARRNTARTWRIAATFAMIALASLLTLIVKSAVFDRTIEADTGEWKNIALADGSVVHVGPRTRLSLEFTGQRRLVHLHGGEAYFEVAKDPQRAFIVDTGSVEVRAVGTAFGVVSRGKEVVVTVREGKVALTRGGDPSTTHVVGVEQRAIVVPLSAGEQATVSDGSAVVPRQVNVERELAWTQRRLIFDSSEDTVGGAVAEFNLRNSVQIELGDPMLARKAMQGTFRADDPNAFVEALEKAGIATVIRERGVLRLESPPQRVRRRP